MISMIVYTLCCIPSRAWNHFCDKSLRFDSRADAAHFEDLLANGDTESVRRILKALQQRGDIDLFESETEIYVIGRRGGSADKRRKMTPGLLVSDYDPVEDFRNLGVMPRFNHDARVAYTEKDLCVSQYEAVSATHQEESKDDLFASNYDIIELLENLTVRSSSILAVHTPS